MDGTESREAQFREFVAARSTALLRLAYLVSGDRNEAEDLVQTALASTYLAWRRLAGPGPGGTGSAGIESLEAYSRRVLLNAATSRWRRRWRGEQLCRVDTALATTVPDLHYSDNVFPVARLGV